VQNFQWTDACENRQHCGAGGVSLLGLGFLLPSPVSPRSSLSSSTMPVEQLLSTFFPKDLPYNQQLVQLPGSGKPGSTRAFCHSGYTHVRLTLRFRATFSYISKCSLPRACEPSTGGECSHHTRTFPQWHGDGSGSALLGLARESRPIPSSLRTNTSGCPTPRSTRGV
jgi:hypothetical protein